MSSRRILAIDLSGRSGGAALLEQEADGEPRTIAEHEGSVRGEQMVRLFAWIDRLLQDAGWSRNALDGFVATHGPGSFTGIRVALGTLRGLSLATGRPAVGVTTLEAVAEAHGPDAAGRIPLIGAGRGEVYGAWYDGPSSPPVELSAPRVGRLAALLQDAGGMLVLCTSELQSAVEARGLRWAPSPTGIAAAAGRIALRSGRLDDPGAAPPLSPLYLRPPDATPGRRGA